MGPGDIISDFVASCRKYALRPGLYYHTGYNADCNVDNPGRVRYGNAEAQVRYNRIVDQQFTNIVSLLWDLQPQAVVFQELKGTGSLIR